ncbi:hypothetical protein [uncultured Dialister sp.]|uniref:hypothetical protein n=1 Tax=uncultured Dialister sp. TaxID=278064 RepID=UPI0025F7A35D|nr:hypothetical protein [uncultured Dialister sp.]
MGSGNSGLYSKTRGMSATPGSMDLMIKNDDFSRNIKRRKDIDSNGFYDIIAHGSPTDIKIAFKGKLLSINHRILARLLKSNPEYKDGAIRLLSCSTGKIPNGFAQNLANKLNRPVKAPTSFLWAWPSGIYLVADGHIVNGSPQPLLNRLGKFKTFYPQGGKRK